MDLKDKIKIFFFDIDFTAFDHVHFLIRPLTMYGLRELKKKGYKICISSSRALEEMSAIEKEFIEIMDSVITIAGGLVFIGDEKIANYIDHKDINNIFEYFDNNDVIYRYATSDGRCFLSRTNDYINELFYKYYHMIPDVKKYEGEDLVQIMYYPQREVDNDKVNKEIEEIAKDLTIVHLQYSNEISPSGIDKGNTIKNICEHFGYSLDEAMAFGDSENDVTMMEKATFGACMGNGTDVCKKAADYICEAQDKDGIYHTLVKFGFIDEYKFDEGLIGELKKGMDEHLKQIDTIKEVGELFAKTIIDGGVIQMLGINKCEQFCQELFYRSGGLAPFNKLVYKNQSLEELLSEYKLNNNDTYMLISDDDQDILIELAKNIKTNNQKLVLVTRNKNSLLNEYCDIRLDLIDSNSPLRYTIDDCLAQMISAETYTALKNMNYKPDIFVSNNKENSKEHNEAIMNKYEGRIKL